MTDIGEGQWDRIFWDVQTDFFKNTLVCICLIIELLLLESEKWGNKNTITKDREMRQFLTYPEGCGEVIWFLLCYLCSWPHPVLLCDIYNIIFYQGRKVWPCRLLWTTARLQGTWWETQAPGGSNGGQLHQTQERMAFSPAAPWSGDILSWVWSCYARDLF